MTRVIQVGVGPLGQRVVRFAVKRKALKIVAAVDPAPDKAGRDLGELCGLKPLGVEVSKDLEAALKSRKADVALLTTVSDVKRIEPQIGELAKAGLNIVSTCEELVYPWAAAPRAAKRLYALCKRHKVTCLGTGVNPGFLMDFLPTAFTAVCQDVKKIVVRRIQDASPRRVPFQQKIGAGLTLAQFKKKKAAGTLRHVGLTESMYLMAARMGWTINRTTETLRPVIAEKRITSGYAPIMPGMACGVEQIGRAFIGRKAVIVLEFRAAVGEPRSYDQVEITGTPNLASTIEDGVNGDIATCAIVLNAIRSVVQTGPGLKTMSDIPAVAFGT